MAKPRLPKGSAKGRAVPDVKLADLESERSHFKSVMSLLAPIFAGMKWASANIRPRPKPRPRATATGRFVRFYMPKKYRLWQKAFQSATSELTIPLGRIIMAIGLQFKTPGRCPKKFQQGLADTFCGLATCDVDNGSGSVMDAKLTNDSGVVMLIVWKSWGPEDRVTVGFQEIGDPVWPPRKETAG